MRRHRTFIALLAGLIALMPLVASATPVTGELFYTRFSGAPNVRSVDFDFDGTTFTLGAPNTIGTTAGADGIAGNPRNSDLLLIGGQGPRINTISKSTGTPTVFPSPVSVFHLEVSDPTTVYGSGIPGSLVRHRINIDGSLAPGTVIGLSGDHTTITQLITTPSGFFYTSSGPGGSGGFGTLTFTGIASAATSAISSSVAAAHGGTYDPFTDTIILMGDSEIAQYDLTGALVSSRSFAGAGLQFDQGTVDGEGHLFVASNSGHLLFMDYAASGLVGDLGNFSSVQFLDSALDDVAPLVGPGTTTRVPEPGALVLLGLGLLGLAAGRRRKT